MQRAIINRQYVMLKQSDNASGDARFYPVNMLATKLADWHKKLAFNNDDIFHMRRCGYTPIDPAGQEIECGKVDLYA